MLIIAFFLCLISGGRFARYCGKMNSRHLLFLLRIAMIIRIFR